MGKAESLSGGKVGKKSSDREPRPQEDVLAKIFEAHGQRWAALGIRYQCRLHNLEKVSII